MSDAAPDDGTTVSLADAFDRIDEHWAPRLAAELNGQHVKLAKLRGAFEWHRHADADELFLVVAGALDIERRDAPTVHLEANELHVVPAGVEHRPVVPEETGVGPDGDEAHVLLFEPAGTLNTGEHESERTREVEAL
ncbi:cupin domain-containing protein [Haloglomus litoreum]|uniref:cupin domain-containing protein n=1 Tax=Haloglomus litoreum TaxID=3034026 RepID=UPI0023E8F552|nr:cupin domain-containing protein [Haloglomus sp. DT116]